MESASKVVDAALAALADPTRRRVVELLIDAPRRTNELAELAGVSVPAVSRHLRILRERGLVDRVDVEGDGRGRRYTLAPDRLDVLASWLGGEHWTKELPNAVTDPDAKIYLARVGGFLDGFAERDATFFERHLADDVELYFAGTSKAWDKASTVASVASHAPYIEWTVTDSSMRALSPHLVMVVITVMVRTTAVDTPRLVVQSMLFDDSVGPSTDQWVLRFLQQSPAQ